jgi:L-seryl-tRNA(Ser) seleniumtransferase
MPQPVDRFGNPFAPGLPYARGRILTNTEDDVRKVQRAGRVIGRRIRDHGPGSVFNFSGLERGLPLEAPDLAFADDEIAPAIFLDRFRALALEHLGGDPHVHDARLFNRVTAAVTAAHLALVRPGDVVVGVSAGYSHQGLIRAAVHAGARFIDTRGVEPFREALEREPSVALVALTRLAVTYDALPEPDIREIVRLAREKGALVYVDDAGGARVGPAVFDQTRMLQFGVDVGATGLDKYGTVGPRLGLLAGEKSLVARIYARALEFGLEARPMLYPAAVRSLEQYTPARVRVLVDTTKQVGAALRARLGARLHETPVTAQVLADDVLEVAMERGHVDRAPVVPVEATAALAMLLLEDYGVITVHFAGLPPGTSSLLLKFIPPETLARFGGPDALAKAVDHSLSKLGGYLREPDSIRELLLGGT